VFTSWIVAAVGVVSSLLNPALKPAFMEKNLADQDKLRRDHLAQRDTRPLLTIAQARERRTPIEWKAGDMRSRRSPTRACFENFPLGELVRSLTGRPSSIRGIARALSVHPG